MEGTAAAVARETADFLEIARKRFGELRPAEAKLLHAAHKGEIAFCGPTDEDADPRNNPSNPDNSSTDRQIAGEFIRWLCLNKEAKDRIDPRGVRVHAASIVGEVDLSFLTMNFPVSLVRCRLSEQLNLMGSEIARLELTGSWIQGTLIKALNGQYRMAINAVGTKLNGDIGLREVDIEGGVWLLSAQIGGNLDCRKARLKNSGEIVLMADTARVSGHCLLSDFHAEGEVNFYAARIGGTLNCERGTFQYQGTASTSCNGLTLQATLVEVAGDVLLRNGFSATGTVRLVGTKIRGMLDSHGATFERLDLTGTSANCIVDDERSWPKSGNLLLDGFVYERISEGPVEAAKRLAWVRRQASFNRQPYRQLAKVMLNGGDKKGWRTVCIEMERDTWRNRGWGSSIWSALLRNTIGYGYSSLRALWGFSALVLIGWAIYWMGFISGSIVPTQAESFRYFEQNCYVNEPHYERFHALTYSLESSFPLVKLGIQDKWQPAPLSAVAACRRTSSISGSVIPMISPTFVRVFRWIQICIGWMLTTLFGAGVTGATRKD